MAEAVEERRSGPKTVKDVPADAFIKAFAAHLKKSGKVQLPNGVDMLKTGAFKELNPLDGDWYYIRAAAIARRVYCRQNIGVGAFRKLFGGRSHPKGKVAPEHFAKAAGGVIRHALQQLEALDLVAKSSNPKGGRRVTPQGQREMDLVASGIKVEPFALLLE